jgi:very-short-patch-repair endonuclease
MSALLDQYAIQAAQDHGWAVKVPGEARLALALTHAGLGPDILVQQFPLGPYRLDFAHPLYRLDIEADGWVHTAQKMRHHDHRRDRQLRAWGWDVVRVASDDEQAVNEAVRYLAHRILVTMPKYGGPLYREGTRKIFGAADPGGGTDA